MPFCTRFTMLVPCGTNCINFCTSYVKLACTLTASWEITMIAVLLWKLRQEKKFDVSITCGSLMTTESKIVCCMLHINV